MLSDPALGLVAFCELIRWLVTDCSKPSVRVSSASVSGRAARSVGLLCAAHCARRAAPLRPRVHVATHSTLTIAQQLRIGGTTLCELRTARTARKTSRDIHHTCAVAALAPSAAHVLLSRLTPGLHTGRFWAQGLRRGVEVSGGNTRRDDSRT